MASTSRADLIRAILTGFFVFESDKVKRIDVYFGATYDNGAFVKQSG